MMNRIIFTFFDENGTRNLPGSRKVYPLLGASPFIPAIGGQACVVRINRKKISSIIIFRQTT